MIPQALRPKIWRYNHGMRWVVAQRFPVRIIKALYPDVSMTQAGLRARMGVGYCELSRLNKALLRLRDGGLVMREQERYRLTEHGRWLAITCMIGIPFVELCILACACCVAERYARSGKEGCYMRSYFEGALGEYYSRGYLSKAFSDLARRGLVVRHSKKAIKVRQDARDDLVARYGPDLRSLESWLDKLEQDKLEIMGSVLEGFAREKNSMT